jgi:transcription elongation GreA/GreB family factor
MGYMSEEGYHKLVAQLKHLEAVERPKVINAIAEARDKGDLSENAEYDAAKEAQGMLESKINEPEADYCRRQDHRRDQIENRYGSDTEQGDADECQDR